MKIREANNKEWKEIRDLYSQLLKSDPESFVDEHKEIHSRSEEKWIEDFNKQDGKIFVAEDQGKLVGMGRINFYQELPRVPVLHKLGVIPEYRGKGIAKELVKVRENWAKEMGAEKVRLYVIKGRDKTIEFSKKNGYEIVEIAENNTQRKDGTPVSVVIMEKDL